ncbi:MAG: ORF6N domain-containing protein [Bacteroidales bacterium]|nr:ORF6N domain-containing protein [Bacteroidales bacterium]
MNEDNVVLIPDELILSKIYQIRDMNVMLDMDLAELYGVETKQLKRAVRRNINRFPPDFMFELSQKELFNWRSQFGTSNREKMGLRIPPFAFTEYGIIMLASVLNSERAVQVNIRIVRIFLKMREILLAHKDFIENFRQIDHILAEHDNKILLIFEYLKQLEQDKQQQDEQANRKRIGFKQDVQT